jgi:hypothetical protein
MKVYLITSILLLFVHFSFASGFVENKGQLADQNGNVNNEVLYIHYQGDLKITLRQNGFSYEKIKSELSEEDILSKAKDQRSDFKIPMQSHRVDFVFPNRPHRVMAELPKQHLLNFYQNNSAITTIRTFEKITFFEVSPGIDVVFSINSAGLFKYDIVCSAPASLKDFKISVDGANRLTLAEDELKINTELGDIIETIPYSYEVFPDGTKQNKTVRYHLVENNLFFQVQEDWTNKLIIDPEPEVLWGTYFGGNGTDWGLALASDKDNNVFQGGLTNSFNNISTVGAHQVNFAGDLDGFVNKFDADGNLIWASYYGGSSTERPYAITTDNSGNVYLGGATFSETGIATAGTYQPFLDGVDDAFVVKFAPNGIREWGTYYGGPLHDFVTDMVHHNGRIYFGGHTESTSGIATSGVFVSNINQVESGFLAAITDDGTQRIWGTYTGGGHNTSVEGVAIWGNKIAVGGRTMSQIQIATANSFQPNFFQGAFVQAFAQVFNDDGTIHWGTYYGGQFSTQGTAVAVWDNHLYLVGNTNSGNNIATPGAHQETRFDEHAFLVKLDEEGDRVWGTYVGGNMEDYINSITAYQDMLVVAGGTRSTQFIASANAHQTTNAGDMDGFINAFNSDGDFLWGTYIGGENKDEIKRIVHFNNGSFLVGGITDGSTSGIATTGTHQTNFFGGPDDAFLVKFCTVPNLEIIEDDGSLIATPSSNLLEWFFEGAPTNVTGGEITPTDEGEYLVVYENRGKCRTTATYDFEFPEDDTANVNNLEYLPFKIFPNPFDEFITVKIPFEPTETLQWSITDITGKEVSFSMELVGNQTIQIHVPNLAMGTYVLSIESLQKKHHYLIQKN